MPQFLGPQGTANAALYTGVAFVLDLFSAQEMILTFRDRQREEGGQGAVLLAAGPCFTATNGHCSEYGIPTRIVDTPEEARREVADLAIASPDVVKVVYDHQSYSGRSSPTIDLPTLTAVLETAREHGLRTIVHVGTWQDVRDAALAGADAVTHTPGPDPPPPDLVEILVQAGTFHIPTLAVQSDFARMLDDPGLLDDPLLVETVPAALLEAYRSDASQNQMIVGWLAWQRTLMEPNLEAVRTLAAAGVPMLTGTDGGNFGVFQGYSVHRELDLLAEARTVALGCAGRRHDRCGAVSRPAVGCRTRRRRHASGPGRVPRPRPSRTRNACTRSSRRGWWWTARLCGAGREWAPLTGFILANP